MKSQYFTKYRLPIYLKSCMLLCMAFLIGKINGQYNKNPLLEIGNDGYVMIVEKFVKIPDDNGNRPRINCMTFFQERLFASTEGGRIYEIADNGNGTHQAELFFDVNAAIPLNTGRDLVATGNWHSGLRSVAFHPEFLTNGKFYTSLMEERPADTSGHHYLSDVDTPIGADGTLIEWTHDFNNHAVDTFSYRELFRVGIPYFDHAMKDICFNWYAQKGDEDYGLLYISHGDGNPYFAPAEGGQNNDGRGKVIRINPLQTDSTRYSIPPTNPFVNDTNWIDELYAVGFRNSHTLCFGKDAAGNVYLISANAGRDNIEEINIVKKGENYGWSKREGTYVQLPGGGLNTGIEALPDNDAVFGFTYPAAQWSRVDPVFSAFSGFSIAGGYVYSIAKTGEKIFLSADFPQSGLVMYNDLDEMTGAITKLDPGNPSIDEPEELTQAQFKLLNVYFDNDGMIETPPVKKTSMLDIINDEPTFDNSGRSDLRFGQDKDENIYITSKRNGWIYKIQTITDALSTAIAGQYSQHEIEMKVYPDPVPVSGILKLSFAHSLQEPAIVSLISTDGRRILQRTISAGEMHYEIDLKSLRLKQGYYVLQVYSGLFNAVKSLIIQ